jgi:rRNA maturation endonuclease Nob1
MFLILAGSGVLVIFVVSVLLRGKNRWEVAWMKKKCRECGTVVIIKDAEFCPTCGARLPTEVTRIVLSKDQIRTEKPSHKSPRVDPIGTCLICDLDIYPFEVLTRCPHCGNFFHKAHLVAWVRMRKRCPACGERLVESEIKEPYSHPKCEEVSDNAYQKLISL